MQPAETLSNAPVTPSRTIPTRGPRTLVTIILLVVIVVLIGAGLSWLQWTSQRGIELGYPRPTVRISAPSSDTLHLDQDTRFHAQATGRDLTYTWSFDDQSTDQSSLGNTGSASGQDVSYTYHNTGQHTVTIVVQDAIGQTVSNSMTVDVLPPPPVAHFTSQIYTGFFSSNTAYFDASSSSADSSTTIQSYIWDFGDGSTDTTSYSQENHDYTAAGTYTVKLIVTDQFNQQSQPFTDTVTIGSNNS